MYIATLYLKQLESTGALSLLIFYVGLLVFILYSGTLILELTILIYGAFVFTLIYVLATPIEFFFVRSKFLICTSWNSVINSFNRSDYNKMNKGKKSFWLVEYFTKSITVIVCRCHYTSSNSGASVGLIISE